MAVKMNIGGVCKLLILKGKSDKEILEIVKGKFVGAKTSKASLAWYKTRLREEGLLVGGKGKVEELSEDAAMKELGLGEEDEA